VADSLSSKVDHTLALVDKAASRPASAQANWAIRSRSVPPLYKEVMVDDNTAGQVLVDVDAILTPGPGHTTLDTVWPHILVPEQRWQMGLPPLLVLASTSAAFSHAIKCVVSRCMVLL
jgi:hypothetical protein